MHSMPLSWFRWDTRNRIRMVDRVFDMKSAASQTVLQACRIASGSQLRSRAGCSRVDKRGRCSRARGPYAGFRGPVVGERIAG